MDAATRRSAISRAGSRCEYCRMLQAHDALTFEVEHVIPRKHDGPTVLDNLALACFPCNRFKGPNLSGIDPVTKFVVTLYHPRLESWEDHFVLENGVIRGLTPTGRATVVVLRMNDPSRVILRLLGLELGDE